MADTTLRDRVENLVAWMAVPPVAGLLGAVALARSARPIHTVGQLYRGALSVTGESATGIPLFDHSGSHEVVCRVSQAIAVRSPRKQVWGLAIRVPGAGRRGGPADLFVVTADPASSGPGAIRRRATVWDGPSTSLIRSGTDAGAALLGFFPSAPGVGELRVLHTGSAVPVGRLEIDLASTVPGDVRFEPGRHDLVGMRAPTWLTILRSNAYAASRLAGRGATG